MRQMKSIQSLYIGIISIEEAFPADYDHIIFCYFSAIIIHKHNILH